MAKPLQKYWDSDCFLGWLKGEPDKVSQCKGTVEKAQMGEVEIFISAITLTEVIKLKGKARLKKSDEDKIREFFENDFITLVNVDKFVAELARQLMWKYEFLDPKDSIHVATAIYKNIPVLNTFDGELLKLDNQLELANKSSKLRICNPDIHLTGEFSFNK